MSVELSLALAAGREAARDQGDVRLAAVLDAMLAETIRCHLDERASNGFGMAHLGRFGALVAEYEAANGG